MKKTVTIIYCGVSLIIEGNYISEEKEIRYDSNIEGTPYLDSIFEIKSICVNDIDIIDLLSDDKIDDIQDKVNEIKDE